MHGCPRRTKTQVAPISRPNALKPVPNIDSLRAKQLLKRNRFKNYRGRTGYLHDKNNSKDGSGTLRTIELFRNDSMNNTLHATDGSSRPDLQVIEFQRYNKHIASYVRGLFPTGVMVAVLIFLLNVVVLIRIPSPDFLGFLDDSSIEYVAVGSLLYLIVGTVTKLTMPNQDFIN